jgi:hypothetical protein
MKGDKSKSAGGNARAESLSGEKRKEIAQKAAKARWQNAELPIAEFAGELKFGDLHFPCAVLSDGTRVLTETDFMSGLGMYRSGALSVRRETVGDDGAQTPLYLAFKNLSVYVFRHLGDVHVKPMKYRTLSGGVAHGIPANLIPKICAIWLDARRDSVLGKRQSLIADRAEMLLRGLAEVGIIALVDEVTGFQRVRSRDALSKILEAFVAKELQPWVKTFPSDFYEEMFRLRGLPFPNETVKKPQYFGHLTNDVIYRRLAPGVLAELKKEAERTESKPQTKLHQRLTQDFGHPKLRELLISVTTVMKLSDKWPDFKAKLDRVHPIYNETLSLPLDNAEDSGIGI